MESIYGLFFFEAIYLLNCKVCKVRGQVRRQQSLRCVVLDVLRRQGFRGHLLTQEFGGRHGAGPG